MIGGVFTSFMLELLVYPVRYITWKWHYELKHGQALTVNTTGSNPS